MQNKILKMLHNIGNTCDNIIITQMPHENLKGETNIKTLCKPIPLYDNPQALICRKYSNSNGSLSNRKLTIQMRKDERSFAGGKCRIILESNNKKFSFNLKEEKSFLQKIGKIPQRQIGPFIDENIDIASLHVNENEHVIPDHTFNYKCPKLNKQSITPFSGLKEDMNLMRSQTGKKEQKSKTIIRCNTTDDNHTSCQMMLKNRDVSNRFENVINEFNMKKENNNCLLIMQKENNKNKNKKEKGLGVGFITNSGNDINYMKNNQEYKISNMKSQNFLEICLICDLYATKKNSINLEACHHIFCVKCGKNYFEEKIEQGEKEMTCPIYKCRKSVSVEKYVKPLVSEKHYEKLVRSSEQPVSDENINNNNNMQLILDVNKKYNQAFALSAKEKTTYAETIKNYTKKHVIDVSSNNESYLCFQKLKEHFCQICANPSLYGRLNGNMMKCLNCFNTFCKFCFKQANLDHFDRMSRNYCKVYSKRIQPGRSRFVEEDSAMKKFLKSLAVVSFSYALLFMYMINHLKDCVNYFFCLKNNNTRIVFQFLKMNERLEETRPYIGERKVNPRCVVWYYVRLCIASMINVGIFLIVVIIFWGILPFFPVLNILLDRF